MKKLSMTSLKRKVNELQEENRKLKNEREAYVDFSRALFKFSATTSENTALPKIWILNRLGNIFSNYGMPRIDFTEEKK